VYRDACQPSDTTGWVSVRQANPNDPSGMLKFFAESGAGMPRLRRASVAAAFVTLTAGRFFVLVVGKGRHLIKAGACEERFGLRVTLNSVDPKCLHAVDVSTLEANPFHARCDDISWNRSPTT
jgi:uncharacterized protein (TIGR04141 family)